MPSDDQIAMSSPLYQSFGGIKIALFFQLCPFLTPEITRQIYMQNLMKNLLKLQNADILFRTVDIHCDITRCNLCLGG